MPGLTAQQKREPDFLEKYGFPIWLYPVFVIVVILFAFCTEWDSTFGVDKIVHDSTIQNGDVYRRHPAATTWKSGIVGYSMYMDASAMCVLGFGFLYVFSKYHSWGGVGLNFFICGFCYLWNAIAKCFVTSMLHGEFHKTQINLTTMVESCYITAAILISLGAFYGFTSFAQVIVICIIEAFMMVLNADIVFKYIKVQDAGGSLVTHMFGAYFGIAVVLAMGVKAGDLLPTSRSSSYNSNLSTMVGTLVLWMFWPSFNGALFYNDDSLQGRVVMNTYLALGASCATAFATSTLAHRGRLEMLEVQNATLAGGVIIGMICSFDIDPWVSVLIGGLGGALSSFGYAFLHPLLEDFGITDSAAVQMLHGIPGLLGGVFAALACLEKNQNYLYSYNTQWESSDECDRTKEEQFGWVLLAIVCSLGISILSGLLTGLLIRFFPLLPSIEKKNMLLDNDTWNVPESRHDPRGDKQRRKSVAARGTWSAKQDEHTGSSLAGRRQTPAAIGRTGPTEQDSPPE